MDESLLFYLWEMCIHFRMVSVPHTIVVTGLRGYPTVVYVYFVQKMDIELYPMLKVLFGVAMYQELDGTPVLVEVLTTADQGAYDHNSLN